jgi:hypothetical protein
VVEERTALGEDRRSLSTKAPVASSKSMSILINDTYFVPPEGLWSQALLTGSFSGPFQVRRCGNLAGPDANLLTIQASTGTVEVRLPVGDRVPLDDVVGAIRLADTNGVLAVGSYNGAIRLLDSASIGPRSFLRVGGKGADAVGWVDQKGTRGKMLYPPWKLHSEESVYPSPSLANALTVVSRYPVFKWPLRDNPTIKISYVATPERCPRCQGTYVENDYRFNRQGDFILIKDEDLLYQSCLKILLTKLGSNPFHTSYGSRLMDYIGAKRMSEASLLIKQDITTALAKVQSIQGQLKQFQTVSTKEMLYKVLSVDVVEGADPTTFLVSVLVQNASATPVKLSIVYTAPGATALGGSNGLMLGATATGLGVDQA